MRVLTIVGARPQFIKSSPFSKAVRQFHNEYLVHTGQHFDNEMSDIFFKQLGIPEPDVNLGVFGGTHAQQTSQMMMGLEKVLIEQAPDWVIVFGDTNSTLAGALVASKLQIPIAHVEAGMRSYNRTMPEEINRVLTDHVSDLLFCPTPVAVENLKQEGINKGVLLTGDIMVDAVMRNIESARANSSIHKELGLSEASNYVVATIHRPANVDIPAKLKEIFEGLGSLNFSVIFPLHPRTRKILNSTTIPVYKNIHIIDPLGYQDMLAIVDQATVLVTDSGGLQKEAYILKTPCVTVRTETEWTETVESGWNRLAAPERNAIVSGVQEASLQKPDSHPDFYGDGNAAKRMVAALNDNSI